MYAALYTSKKSFSRTSNFDKYYVKYLENLKSLQIQDTPTI